MLSGPAEWLWLPVNKVDRERGRSRRRLLLQGAAQETYCKLRIENFQIENSQSGPKSMMLHSRRNPTRFQELSKFKELGNAAAREDKLACPLSPAR